MGSSIPGAVSYFMALARTALNAASPEPPVLVVLSKPLPRYTAPVTLQVFGARGTQKPAQIGPDFKREEIFRIQCELSSFAGDQDMESRLSEVMAAFELVTVAVANDLTLGGNVRYAQMVDLDFTPDANAAGQSIGRLLFDVDCQQRIASLT